MTPRPSAARDVAPGRAWSFGAHRSMADVLRAEAAAARSPLVPRETPAAREPAAWANPAVIAIGAFAR